MTTDPRLLTDDELATIRQHYSDVRGNPFQLAGSVGGLLDHIAAQAERIREIESAFVVAGIERLIDATAGLFICQTDGGVAVLHNGKTHVNATLSAAVSAAMSAAMSAAVQRLETKGTTQ